MVEKYCVFDAQGERVMISDGRGGSESAWTVGRARQIAEQLPGSVTQAVLPQVRSQAPRKVPAWRLAARAYWAARPKR